jgi:hypothetical protein
MMSQAEIKLQCLVIANGDLDKAKDLFNWVILEFVPRSGDSKLENDAGWREYGHKSWHSG